jgi:hypothetical protein
MRALEVGMHLRQDPGFGDPQGDAKKFLIGLMGQLEEVHAKIFINLFILIFASQPENDTIHPNSPRSNAHTMLRTASTKSRVWQ